MDQFSKPSFGSVRKTSPDEIYFRQDSRAAAAVSIREEEGSTLELMYGEPAATFW
jgi:hypothetical protein